jgi:serine protease Do
MAAMIALLVAIAMIVTTTQARAQAAPPSFADLVDQVGDAVVNITTSAVVASRQGPAPNVPPGSPLEDFFNDFLDRQQGPENARAAARRWARASSFPRMASSSPTTT